MFRDTTIKLAASYLAIIMTMSIGFSFILYRISSHELERGLRLPPTNVQPFTQPLNYETFRIRRVNEGSSRLKTNLVLFNLISLGASSFLSYALARRTLYPIEEAMDAQSRFTADASHELRTPLASMKTEIEVALRNPKLSTKTAAQLLTSNLEEVEKLSLLSDGLLKLARQGTRQFTFETVELKSASQEAIKQVKTKADQRKIVIKNNIVVTKAVQLNTDKQAIAEMLVILLDNAIKYSEPGKSITLNARKHSHYIQIEVKDEGCGIPESDIQHIFERFYRADSSRTKNDGNGYGLGLAIAAQIARQLHGSISVTSKVDKGSDFIINLPG